MNTILCLVTNGEQSTPVIEKVSDPKVVSIEWIAGRFPKAKKVRASWYTGTDQNILYYESNN